MPFRNFDYSNTNDVLLVTLNNQESQNALSPEMAQELSDLLYEEMPKALLLTHQGPSFCSGGNLRFYKSLESKEDGLKINKHIRRILEELHSLEIPKACYVNGNSLGGGIELLSCFDYIVSSPSSLFGLWQRRIGLSFGWGGGERLLKRLSEKDLKNWLYNGSTIDAYQARELGLVDSIELNNKGMEKAFQWLEQVKKWGEESFQKIKSEKKESETFKSLWHSDRHKEILSKFK